MFKNIGFIGAGHMGSAMVKCWLQVQGLNIHVLEKDAGELPVKYYTDPSVFLNCVDIIIVAVRPSSWPEVKAVLKDCSLPKISIMAGITLSDLSIVPGLWARVMPNLPVALGLGCLALYCEDNLPADLLQMLGYLGRVVHLSAESDMHAFTAIAGSGPAWLWHYANQWHQVALELGFSWQVAHDIVLQTIVGAAAITGNKGFSDLCQSVASKGGTTEKGLSCIDDGVRAAIMAAYARSKELAQE